MKSGNCPSSHIVSSCIKNDNPGTTLKLFAFRREFVNLLLYILTPSYGPLLCFNTIDCLKLEFLSRKLFYFINRNSPNLQNFIGNDGWNLYVPVSNTYFMPLDRNLPKTQYIYTCLAM